MTHSPRGRFLPALALAACSAALLLAGCGAGAQTAPADGTAREDLRPPAAGSGAPLDWKSAAYSALDCPTRAEWMAEGLPADAWDAQTVHTTFADVTGDGTDEALVQAVCPAAVSTRADHVVVFDAATEPPDLLGVLGDDLFQPQADITTEDATVTLRGPTVAGDDPYCCPGHWGTITYAWDGAGFVVRSRSEVPGTLPGTSEVPADGGPPPGTERDRSTPGRQTRA